MLAPSPIPEYAETSYNFESNRTLEDLILIVAYWWSFCSHDESSSAGVKDSDCDVAKAVKLILKFCVRRRRPPNVFRCATAMQLVAQWTSFGMRVWTSE